MKVGWTAIPRQDGAIAKDLRAPGTFRMARTYAAILALVGMLVVLTRALKGGASFEETSTQAITWMVILALVGTVVGTLAQSAVDESVRAKVHAELEAHAARNDEKQNQPTT